MKVNKIIANRIILLAAVFISFSLMGIFVSLILFAEPAKAEVRVWRYNATNASLFSVFNKSDDDTTTPPAWTSGWDGSNVSASYYANVLGAQGTGINVTSGGQNDEPWVRFNVTIIQNKSQIVWVHVSLTQRKNSLADGGEDCTYIMANYTSSGGTGQWFKFASDVTGITDTQRSFNLSRLTDSDQFENITDGYATGKNLQVGNLVIRANGINEDADEGCVVTNASVHVGYDDTAPIWSNATTNFTYAYPSIKTVAAMRGELINISANVTDNYGVFTAWLLTNETGGDRNYTYDQLANSSNYTIRILGGGSIIDQAHNTTTEGAMVNWTWQNMTGAPRAIKWHIFVNDTANNTNGTTNGASGIADIGNFTMWGWANVTPPNWLSSQMVPASATPGNVVYIQVNVSDVNLTWLEPINSYNVTFFYRQEPGNYVSLGANWTNSSGIAGFYWDTTGLSGGRYFPMANITHNATLFYNTTYVHNSTNGTIDLAAAAVVNYGNGTLQVGVSSSTDRAQTVKRAPIINLVQNPITAQIVGLFKSLTNAINALTSIPAIFAPLRLSIISPILSTPISNFFTQVKSIAQAITSNFVSSNLGYISRSIANAITTSPLTARIVSLIKIITSPFVFAFQTIAGKVLQFQTSLTLSVTSTASRIFTGVRPISNAITFSTITARITNFGRSLINALSFNTIATRTASFFRTISQPFTFTTQVTGVFAQGVQVINRAVELALSITNTATRIFTAVTFPTQQLSFTTLVQRITLLNKALTNTLSFNALAIRSATFLRIASQSSTFLTNVTTAITILTSRVATLTISMINTATRIFTAVTFPTQQLSFTTLVQRITLLNKALTNAISFNTISSRIAIFSRQVSQPFVFSFDLFTRVIVGGIAERTAALQISLSNSASAVLTAARFPTSAITTNTIVLRTQLLFKALSQTLNFSTISARILSTTRTVFTNLTFLTSSIRTRIVPRVTTAAITFSNAIEKSLLFVRPITAQITFAQNAIKQLSFFRTITQTINLNDLVIRSQPFLRIVTGTFRFNFGATAVNQTGTTTTTTSSAGPGPAPSAGSGAGSGAGGGAAAAPGIPISILAPPPSFIPTPTVAIDFTQIEVLQEVVPDQAQNISFEIKNKVNTTLGNVTVTFSGVPEDWIKEKLVGKSLNPNEKTEFEIPVSPSRGTGSGDYRVDISVKAGGVVDKGFFIIRVKPNAGETNAPSVTRSVVVNSEEKKTTFTLNVVNVKGTDTVEVQEDIPKTIANSTKEIFFDTPPTKIIKDDPIVEWQLKNFKKGESRIIKYSVQKILVDYAPYVYFPLKQFSISSKSTLENFKLLLFDIPPFYSGHASIVTLRIENSDSKSHNFSFAMGLPEKWSVQPQQINEIIGDNEQREYKLSVYAPSSEPSGIRIIQAQYAWDDSAVIREYSVIVSQIISFDTIIYITIVIIVVSAAYFAIKSYISYRGTPMETLRKLRAIVKSRTPIHLAPHEHSKQYSGIFYDALYHSKHLSKNKKENKL